jgi:two-component system LytT family sensor kinase
LPWLTLAAKLLTAKPNTMKKLLVITVALLSVIISVAQKPIIIKGKIDNCSNRDISYIEKQGFNPKSLQKESKNFDFSIADDGTFRLKITESDDYYVRYWIHLGNEWTHLDLIAGDSIYMTVNGLWFDESIKYTGSGAGRNNYRRDVYLQFWERDVTSRIIYEQDPAQFLSAVNALFDRKLELLDKYWLSGDIDSSYYEVNKAVILNDRANLVLKNNSRYLNHKKATGSVARQLASIIDAADFSDDHMLQHSNFRELVLGLPRYMAELNSVTDNVDLKSEIDYANAHYTNAMKLYFDREIIRSYLRNAHSLSEKRSLLAFFAAQFNEPVLKREIQLQRGDITRNQGMNSNLFEAIAVSVMFLLGFLAVLFLIVKLIKITSFKSININISLWLKVAFYLIIFLTAWAYIEDHQVHSKAFVGVFLWLGVFLAHTYLLIPKYNMALDYRRYFTMLGSGFIVYLLGAFICEPIPNSTEFILIGSIFYAALVILSWTSFYIHLLASRKSTFNGLFRDGYLNRELAFNIVVVYFINLLFVAGNTNYSGILGSALLFYPTLLLFYFHAFYSFPRYFSKTKAIQFVQINVAILVVASIGMIVFDGFQSKAALHDLGIEKSLFDLFSLQNIRIDILLLFAAILIPSYAYYTIKEQFQKLDTVGFSLYRKKEAELAQLKAQVNPHFLFNTLNTLYAFALKEGSEKTAECIAKLANLMRFMLDDMEKESILLQREVSYIQDYVKLQSIRSAVEHDIAITIDIEEEQSYSIAPMLLIPFVENAFKHGMNPNQVSHLKIDITGKGQQIQFVIENSIDENFEAYYKEKGFGIGIENVKSRLKHIYPDRHNISIAKTNDKFIVILAIYIL